MEKINIFLRPLASCFEYPKNRYYRILLGLVCTCSLYAAEPQTPDTKDGAKATSTDASLVSILPKISGSLQVLGNYEDLGTGDPKTTVGQTGIQIPRARLAASGELDNKILSYELQINAGETGFTLEDALIEIHFIKWAYATAGQFTMPFGDEIYLSEIYNPFIERSRFWSHLLKENRNIGGMLTIEPIKGWSTDFGYFSTIKVPESPAIRDIMVRSRFEWNQYSTGISFYYDDKRINNSIFEIEKEADIFIKYKGERLVTALELATRFISPSQMAIKGVEIVGWHAYLAYMFNANWEGVLKYSYLSFDKSLNLNDNLIQDVILGINYHFSEFNKIQFNYNPAFHADKIITQMFMIQLQAVF